MCGRQREVRGREVEIELLVRARAEDHRRHVRLREQPREADGRGGRVHFLRDDLHRVEDLPVALDVVARTAILLAEAGPLLELLATLELAGKKATGERRPRQDAEPRVAAQRDMLALEVTHE
jgi:hypothetical protein